LKDEKLILKKQTYTKTEAYKRYSRVFFGHFSQTSSESILTFSSYKLTVLKLARFLRRSVCWLPLLLLRVVAETARWAGSEGTRHAPSEASLERGEAGGSRETDYDW